MCKQKCAQGVRPVELLRIGDKIISRQQIDRWITRILDLRRQGHSQQEVAQKLKIDRTFVSRLESLGELRKGNGVAVIGFPVANGPELAALCRQYGVDCTLLQRTGAADFVSSKSGLDLFNQVMEIRPQSENTTQSSSWDPTSGCRAWRPCWIGM